MKSSPSNNVKRLLLIIFRFGSYFVANRKTFRKRFLSLLIFVFISTSFWFYRALFDTFTTDIKYPLKYINLPSNKTLSGNPPSTITLRIKGTGYALLSNKINPPVINLDVNDFSLYSQSKDSLKVYLISRFAREWFSNEVNLENNSPLEIISISPDTISFNFTRTYSKKVPVVLKYFNQQDVFARQHMQNGKILIVPDSILIIGPANFIDTLNFISTKPLRISELKDTASKKIDIEIKQGIKYSSERIRVTIPVDRFTESTLEVPISVKNLPDSIRIKTFPRTVNITYNVTLTMYNMVSETDFYPYVDYLEISKNITSQEFKLKVHLDSAPDYLHSVSFRPKNVEFLIERNDDKNRIDRGNR